VLYDRCFPVQRFLGSEARSDCVERPSVTLHICGFRTLASQSLRVLSTSGSVWCYNGCPSFGNAAQVRPSAVWCSGSDRLQAGAYILSAHMAASPRPHTDSRLLRFAVGNVAPTACDRRYQFLLLDSGPARTRVPAPRHLAHASPLRMKTTTWSCRLAFGQPLGMRATRWGERSS